MDETELHDVGGFTESEMARLAKSWISTAEQLVAISATMGGLRSLAEQLHVSDDEALRLVELARAALTPEKRAAMDEPFMSDDRGMGAKSPREDDTPRHGGS